MRVLCPFLLSLCVSLLSFAEEAPPPAVSSQVTESELNALTERVAGALQQVKLKGWTRAGEVERYVVANLYDKINGRSELFMAYDVVALGVLNLTDGTDTIEVFLYDMQTPEGAFGIFSVERWPGSDGVNVGREGYRTERDVIFWKGPFYAVISGPRGNEGVAEARLRIAEQLAGHLEDDGETLWGLEALPEEQRVAESVQYFRVDALSLNFMTNTFTALYEREGQEVKVFVSRQSPEQARDKVYEAYAEYMRKYGEGVAEVEFSDSKALSADMGGGYFDVVFVRGPYVAGVTAVEGAEAARAAAQWLHTQLMAK